MRRSRFPACGLAVRDRFGTRLGDESGMALVMALGIMLVLVVTLTTVITFTAAGARDSHRVNAGQKATALAEAGVNNALAVLTSNYPGIVTYPGNPNLLPARTTAYPSGSVTWSGVLETAPSTVSWNDQWRITSVGTVPNPTGPGAAPVTRRTTALVPIVLPTTISVPPSSSSLNTIYAFNDVRFGQSVTVRSPVYANRDLWIEQTATIAETIPANASGPERPNKVAVGRNLYLENPQNKVGHVFGTASPANELGEIYVQGTCSKQGRSTAPPAVACGWGALDDIWGQTTGNIIPPGFVIPPKLTCCSPFNGSIGPDEPPLSVMGFWYRNASVGPYSICDPAQSSGTLPRFDRPTGVDSPDDWIDQSATASRPAFDITGATYKCKTGQGELSYDAGTKKLTINGSIFIDGSAKSGATDATYVGRGALILSGTFLMENNRDLCVKLTTSNDCDIAAPWDPNVSGMFIFAAGDFATDISLQGTSVNAGDGIAIKKGQYQGGLFAGSNVDASVSGTVVQGPMISVRGDVVTGQSGELSFPAISFPTSGSAGFVGPLPLPKLLAPRQFAGG